VLIRRQRKAATFRHGVDSVENHVHQNLAKLGRRTHNPGG